MPGLGRAVEDWHDLARASFGQSCTLEGCFSFLRTTKIEEGSTGSLSFLNLLFVLLSMHIKHQHLMGNFPISSKHRREKRESVGTFSELRAQQTYAW